MNRKKPKSKFSLALAFLFVGTSCVNVRDPDAGGPNTDDGLSVQAGSDSSTVFEGGSVNLTAAAQGGAGSITFRWDQNSGTATTFAAPDSPATPVGPLTQPGHYVFRVTVSDASGAHDSDFVAVEVLPAVTVAAPVFAIIGAPVTIAANLSADIEAASVLWEVTSGTATLGDVSSATTTLTTTRGETVKIRLTVSFASQDQPAATREIAIVSVPDLHPRVRLETNKGDFVIELDGENTPNHMTNFLRYVDEGFYEGLLFHRNACTENQTTGECDPFVLQGGGFRRENGDLVAVDPTHDPIPAENASSPSNGELYTVALALRGGSTASGAAQFFINLSEENSFLDEEGFTVFGRVVEGTDVVDALAETDRVESTVIPGEISLPAEDIVIERIVRVE